MHLIRTNVAAFSAKLHTFINQEGWQHEALVVVVSYLFIFVGSWNDDLLGLQPSLWSHIAEITMATVLSLEITCRLIFTTNKNTGFWSFIAFDCISVLTILPSLQWIALARLIRSLYASGRLFILLDHLACRTRNAMCLVGLYPVAVPLLASVLYAVERHTVGSPVQNYLQALTICFEFALSLGQVRPLSLIGMSICGFLFLLGIVCIGILTNALSTRYERGC